ncbi:hypothetical protein BHM03_00021070 [Ensete ventricosum]|nr:hypothetical protein BHM03_00021070 [Ensete ventricosum]
MSEMLQWANQYIAAEALVVKKQDDQKRPLIEQSRGQPSVLLRRRIERPELPLSRPPPTPLNSTQMEIFLQIQEKGFLKPPNPIKTRHEGRDKRRYCRFYREYGQHDTEECHDLKNQIEDLIH